MARGKRQCGAQALISLEGRVQTGGLHREQHRERQPFGKLRQDRCRLRSELARQRDSALLDRSRPLLLGRVPLPDGKDGDSDRNRR